MPLGHSLAAMRYMGMPWILATKSDRISSPSSITQKLSLNPRILETATEKAIGDALPTVTRTCARLAIARAMWKRGCRENPNWWVFGHLEQQIERELRQPTARCLGAAWMLATILMEKQPLAGRGAARKI